MYNLDCKISEPNCLVYYNDNCLQILPDEIDNWKFLNSENLSECLVCDEYHVLSKDKLTCESLHIPNCYSYSSDICDTRLSNYFLAHIENYSTIAYIPNYLKNDKCKLYNPNFLCDECLPGF